MARGREGRGHRERRRSAGLVHRRHRARPRTCDAHPRLAVRLGRCSATPGFRRGIAATRGPGAGGGARDLAQPLGPSRATRVTGQALLVPARSRRVQLRRRDLGDAGDRSSSRAPALGSLARPGAGPRTLSLGAGRRESLRRPVAPCRPSPGETLARGGGGGDGPRPRLWGTGMGADRVGSSRGGRSPGGGRRGGGRASQARRAAAHHHERAELAPSPTNARRGARRLRDPARGRSH